MSSGQDFQNQVRERGNIPPALHIFQQFGDLSPIEPHSRNLGHFKVEGPIMRLKLNHRDSLVSLFQAALDTQWKLHFISSGKNWGLGSFLPSIGHTLIVDLSALNSLKLNLDEGVALIQPGVTQQQLYDELKDTQWFANITTSSGSTSVLGNALQKGVGLWRQRHHDILGLRVLTSSLGEISTGALKFDEANPRNYADHAGPDLTGIFMQSSLGVVTEGLLKLNIKPRKFYIFRIDFNEPVFLQAVHLLKFLYQIGTLACVSRIYENASVASYDGAKLEDLHGQSFTGYFCIPDHGQKTYTLDDLRQLADSYGLPQTFIRQLDPDQEGLAPLEKSICGCYQGNPAFNDRMIESSFNATATTMDEASSKGWLTVLPILPLNGEALTNARKIVGEFRTRYGDFGMLFAFTMNIIEPNAVDFVVSLRFARTEEAAELAHHAYSELYTRFAECGYLPYRVDTQRQDFLSSITHPSSLKVGKALRSIFDAQNVLASSSHAS